MSSCAKKDSLCQVCCVKPSLKTTKALRVRVCDKNCFAILRDSIQNNQEFVSVLKEKAPLSNELVAVLLSLNEGKKEQEEPLEEFDQDLSASIGDDLEDLDKPNPGLPDPSDYQKVYFNTDLSGLRITIYKNGSAVVTQNSSFPIENDKNTVRFHEIPKRLLKRFIDIKVGERQVDSVEQRNPLDSFSSDVLASIRDLQVVVEYENETGPDPLRTYEGILLDMKSGGYPLFLMNKDGSYTFLPDKPKSIRYPKQVNDVFSDHHELRISLHSSEAPSTDSLFAQYVEDGVSTVNVYKDLGREDGSLVGEVSVRRSHSDVAWDGAVVTISDSTLQTPGAGVSQFSEFARSPMAMSRSAAPTSQKVSDDNAAERVSSTKDLVLETPVRIGRGSKSTTVAAPSLVPDGIDLTNRNVYEAFTYPPHEPGTVITYKTVSQAEIHNGGDEILRQGRFLRVSRPGSETGGNSSGSGWLEKTLPKERSRVDIGKLSDLTVRRSQVPHISNEQDGVDAQEKRGVDKVTVVVQNSRSEPSVVRLREKGNGQNWYVEESDEAGNVIAGGERWEFEPSQKLQDIEAKVPKEKEAFLDVDLGALESKTVYYRIVRVTKLNQ
jgi:hypothetical protein